LKIDGNLKWLLGKISDPPIDATMEAAVYLWGCANSKVRDISRGSKRYPPALYMISLIGRAPIEEIAATTIVAAMRMIEILRTAV
jgi:hypothetical protein